MGLPAELIARRIHKRFGYVWDILKKEKKDNALWMYRYTPPKEKIKLRDDFTKNRLLRKGTKVKITIDPKQLKRVLFLRRGCWHIEEISFFTGVSVEDLVEIFGEYELQEIPINMMPFYEYDEIRTDELFFGFQLDGTT